MKRPIRICVKRRKINRNTRPIGVPSILCTSKDIPRSSSHPSNYAESTVNSKNKERNEVVNPKISYEFLAPSDTIIAMHSLIQLHSAAYCPLQHDTRIGFVPFVLKFILSHTLSCSLASTSTSITQQMASVNSSTYFEREIEHLCRTNIIQIIQLHGTENQHDIAVMEKKHLVVGIWDAHRSFNSTHSSINNDLSSSTHNLKEYKDNKVVESNTSRKALSKLSLEARVQVVHAFIRSLPDITGTYVNQSDLALKMRKKWNKKPIEPSTGYKSPTMVHRSAETNVWIDYLVCLGVLLPRQQIHLSFSEGDNDINRSYWITLPKMAKAAKSITDGRSKIKEKIKRSRFKKVKRSILETSSLSSDSSDLSFSGKFYVLDLLVRNEITVLKNKSGDEVVELLRHN